MHGDLLRADTPRPEWASADRPRQKRSLSSSHGRIDGADLLCFKSPRARRRSVGFHQKGRPCGRPFLESRIALVLLPAAHSYPRPYPRALPAMLRPSCLTKSEWNAYKFVKSRPN
jgi:hypothetical protein